MSDAWGMSAEITRQGRTGTSLFGFEIGGEVITSTNLGNHGRIRSGLFAEYKSKVSDRLHVGVGLNSWRYHDFGTLPMPGRWILVGFGL